MSTLYLIHVSCVVLSISGFALRGYWMFTENPLLATRPAKIIPHTIDTALLVSAIVMLVQWQMSPLAQPWLMVKISALLVYIGLGMVALRFGKTRRQKVGACLLAILTAGYIASVAITKSPWGMLQLLRL
jgi:uncharacterized membrane protein SirB2